MWMASGDIPWVAMGGRAPLATDTWSGSSNLATSWAMANWAISNSLLNSALLNAVYIRKFEVRLAPLLDIYPSIA